MAREKYIKDIGSTLKGNALAVEANDSLAADTYTNIIVVKEGNEDSEKIRALVEAVNSDEVRNHINENYDGAVVPVF